MLIQKLKDCEEIIAGDGTVLHELLHPDKQDIDLRYSLFWLSLFPFVTAWMGENHFAALPVALYGVVLLLAAIAYFTLTRTLVFHHGQDSTLANALGRNFKGKLSVLIYASSIPLAFAIPWLACALYVLVAALWLIPDRRIERALSS